jgi:hypothetical protein
MVMGFNGNEIDSTDTGAASANVAAKLRSHITPCQ